MALAKIKKTGKFGDFHQGRPGPSHALGTIDQMYSKSTAPITSRPAFPENEESE